MSDPLAELVARGDPDRYAATLAAPEAARARLWPLYAFNLEIARAAWASREPLVAQMRLQFWADVMAAMEAGAPVPAHEISGPLAAMWHEAKLPHDLGQQMIAAREWDIQERRFADQAALLEYLQATGGNVMWLAALALGARPEHEETVRAMGLANAIANWLRAVPGLRAAGCAPLPTEKPQAIAELAQTGLEQLQKARRARAQIPASLAPALLTGWQAGPILRQASQYPDRVLSGQLGQSEFTRRGALMLRGLTGRW